jgi:hypothetical protein
MSSRIAARTRGVVVALALSLIAPEARADPTPAERETARALLLSGREKRKAGKLKEALAELERAHGIMGVPTTGLDLGKAQDSLGLLVEARATLLDVARYPAQPDESRAFKRARQEAKELAEAIAPRLATLIVVAPSGAHVKLDGVELSAASVGVALKINPGKHEIFSALNGEERHSSVDLAEGESKSVQLALAGAPVAAPVPAAPTVARAPTAPAEATPETETKPNPLVWVGVVTAGLGVAVGSTTGLLAFSVKDSVTSRCEPGPSSNFRCPSSTYSDIDKGETFATVSTIAFVVAGLGAGILIYGLLNPNTSRTSAAKARVLPSPFGVSGSF